MTPINNNQMSGKKKTKKLIEKLDIDLLSEYTESKYNEEKSKYIAEYEEYEAGYYTGFFGWRYGRMVKKPDVGISRWNALYPNGYTSWRAKQTSLNAYGEQCLINKINELVDALNKITKGAIK